MKKLLIFILNVLLFCSFLTPATAVVGAEESQSSPTLEFVLTSNEKSALTVENNDVITISFVILRTDSNEDYAINAFQNYLHYDLSFFEFVEGSIVCNDTGSAVAQRLNSITYGEIIQCQNMATTYNSSFVFCTFQLRVIATSGSGTVYNDEFFAFDSNFQQIAVTRKNFTATICLHENLTKVTEQAPTCTENGWETYYHCADCGLLFDANNEYVIDEIPYILGGHKTTDEFVTDNDGHWYACENCNEKVDYASHTLKQATCVSKSGCEVCGLNVGEIDPNNHVNTKLINYVPSWFFGDGYSGDVHCLDCDQIVKTGETVSKFKILSWPWWVLLISLPIFPVIILVWIIFY